MFFLNNSIDYRYKRQLHRILIRNQIIKKVLMLNTNMFYRINNKNTVYISDGNFVITNDSGEIIDKISISIFAKKPREGFNKIKKLAE